MMALLCTTVVTVLMCCLSARAHAENLVLPGSSAPEGVLLELAAVFNREQGAHRVSVPPSIGVVGALREIRSGKSSIARIGRALDEAELREGLKCLPFVRDAVVFVLGAAVRRERLTERQLVGIFSGRIANWRELGDAEAPIRVVLRQRGTVALNEIMHALPVFIGIDFSPRAKTTQSDRQTIDLLDRFDYSIGWSTLSNLIFARTALKPVHIEGVAPTAANLANGKYPITVTSCFLYRDGLGGPAAHAFVDFVFSAPGRAVIEKQGLIPVARQSGAVDAPRGS